MAPQKRTSHHHDEDEITAVDSASSSLRQDAQRKKVRLSNGPSKSRSRPDRTPPSEVSDDSDDDIPDANDDDHHDGPQATQYEILRDGNWEHLRETKRDDERATQAFRAHLERKEQIGENHAANNAIIMEITCINFMCHTRLHVALGPLINFVVGHNGSGKSAVMTAITLCLGGKAAATNRGASLKSLIKTGEETGLLIIRLKNEGNDAYQPDTYGDSIIIERQFSRSGSSIFRVKTALGRTISTKKGDVDDIVEYFQLQVDNPMNVLTQDAAKSFITSSTPAQKYKFFKDGVQLSALDNDYNVLCNTCDQIEAKFKESKDDVIFLQKKKELAQAKYDRVKENEGMAATKKLLGSQLAWAQVQDVEKDVARKADAVAEIQLEIENAERTLQSSDEAFQGLEQSLERARGVLHQVQEQISPLKADEDAAKEAFDDAVKAVKTNRYERSLMKESLVKAKAKVCKCENDIQTENRRLEDANGGANARKMVEIDNARERAIEAKSACETHNQQRPQLIAKKEEAQLDVKRLEDIVAMKSREHKEAADRLAGLNSNRSDKMAGFDPKMPRLLNEIRNEKRFRETPIGPMGMHIKLRDPKWSSVLESVLNSVLTSFLVTSKADQIILSELLTRANMAHFCNVSIVNRSSIDTAGNEPNPELKTILNVLDIDNVLVRNYLIINNAVEQAILVERRQEAIKIMYDNPTRPRNVKFCLCIHDSKPGSGIRLGFSGSGGRNGDMGPVHPTPRRPRMTTDIDSQIAFQREAVAHLLNDKQDVEKTLKEASTNLQRCTINLQQHEREKSKLKRAAQSAEEAVDSLTAELEDSQVKDGHLDALMEFLAEAQKELEIEGESYGNLTVEVQTLNDRAAEMRAELQGARDRVAEQEAKIQKCEEKIRRIETGRHHALTEKNLADAQLKGLGEAKNRAVVKHAEAEQKLLEWTEKASRVAPVRVPIPHGETGASLDGKFKKLAERQRQIEQELGATAEEINEDFLRVSTALDNLVRRRQEHQELITMLKQTFMKRMEMFRSFQRHISARSRINFTYLLANRAFRGKLKIDHVSKMLDVLVEPDETTKSGKGRETKGLSGGEKSFASICLLLSLWEAMGAPLRCLDEYDVFMDDVNRDISTKMIISAARNSVGRQFILITPKALGAGIDDGAADVKIIKLFDPRSKQRRLTDMLE